MPTHRSPFAGEGLQAQKPPLPSPGSPVNGRYSSLLNMPRPSFDSPSSGSSASGNICIPAVRTSADLLPYPSFLEKQVRDRLHNLLHAAHAQPVLLILLLILLPLKPQCNADLPCSLQPTKSMYMP